MTPGDGDRPRSYHYSVRGGSHEASGKPCQDSSIHRGRQDFAIVSVADGHGSDRYVRSDKGSELATLISVKTIWDYLTKNPWDEILSNPDSFMEHVIGRIINRWNIAVEADLDENPLTEGEKALAGDLSDRPVAKLFGTTLVVGCLTKEFGFGLQIGDGCFTVHRNGDVYMPMPEDPDCIGNKTSSLCGTNAERKFRHVWLDKDSLPDAITVSTDGLYTTFPSDSEFKAYCDRMVGLIIRGEAPENDARRSIVTNLTKRAHSGPHDDVSVAMTGFSKIHGNEGER